MKASHANDQRAQLAQEIQSKMGGNTSTKDNTRCSHSFHLMR